MYISRNNWSVIVIYIFLCARCRRLFICILIWRTMYHIMCIYHIYVYIYILLLTFNAFLDNVTKNNEIMWQNIYSANIIFIYKRLSYDMEITINNFFGDFNKIAQIWSPLISINKLKFWSFFFFYEFYYQLSPITSFRIIFTTNHLTE